MLRTFKLLLLRWREPSVLRRLLLAQGLLVLLLWLGLIAYVATETLHDTSVFDSGHRFESIIAVTEALRDQPEQLQQVLHHIDMFQRLEDGVEDIEALRMAMVVWRGDQLVYATPGEPGVVYTPPGDGVQLVERDGRRWRALTKQSQHSNTRVTLLLPGSIADLLMAMNSHGFLVLPLLVSLPLLVLPAWASVRLALRPWRRVSAEIASRGGQDLSPLAYAPRHRELRPMLNAVNRLLRRVRESVARERSFIADAAHELRTPLATMRVHAEALQAHVSGAHAQALLDGVLRGGERANHLVGQLLALMRSDAAVDGTAPAQPVMLDELLRERLAQLALLAAERGIELDCEAADGIAIGAPRESLISMLDNLITNAIKYSPPGGLVQVRLTAAAGLAQLSIADHGPGIPAEARERVFDRFYRLPDQAQSGSGLGLAIVASVVQRLGGQIDLQDSPLPPLSGSGVGLCVLLQLPCQADEDAHREAP
ncbi:HAMP domain-containing sensor histidine kinase [Paucibacter sp. APW11]|uniref:histidine kinase n=1 Tax=Roseateles aquae TaxID=3077235 RepID=A0ABU3PEH7_9BURK|nr:HAMP domain-containing sensor histidine kinase [Paucibacter sp. APW11]MDT9000993.1 HAMP domain-containing sensor histidine kinase [Paucibacter sp. APW11]